MRPRNEMTVLTPAPPWRNASPLRRKPAIPGFPSVMTGIPTRRAAWSTSRISMPPATGPRPRRICCPPPRKLICVPETARLERLLQRFLERKSHFAFVVDEFGGTLGIVTLENVVEAIVGQIQDEFDVEAAQFVRQSDNVWEVSGTLALHDLEYIVGTVPHDEGVATASGWITQRLGGFPKVGDTVTVGRLRVAGEDDGRPAGGTAENNAGETGRRRAVTTRTPRTAKIVVSAATAASTPTGHQSPAPAADRRQKQSAPPARETRDASPGVPDCPGCLRINDGVANAMINKATARPAQEIQKRGPLPGDGQLGVLPEPETLDVPRDRVPTPGQRPRQRGRQANEPEPVRSSPCARDAKSSRATPRRVENDNDPEEWNGPRHKVKNFVPGPGLEHHRAKRHRQLGISAQTMRHPARQRADAGDEQDVFQRQLALPARRC